MTAPAKAAECARFAGALHFHLHAASSDFVPRAQQVTHAAKAFQAYEALKGRMDELRVLAPYSSAAGEAEAANLREIAGGGR